jgi:hypothetical protein
VSGSVNVFVNKKCKCKGLTLEAQWTTRSRAGTVKGGAPTEVLFAGEWREGETVRYPFRLRLPEGPCTYDGELLSVGWSLKARADIPWAIDPKAEKLFRVDAAPTANYYAGPLYTTPVAPKGTGDVGALVVRFGIAFVLGVVAFLVIQDQARYEPALWAVPPAIFLVGGALFSLGRIRRQMARRKIGDPEVSFEPMVAAPGQPILITVALSPNGPLELNEIRVHLQAVEKIIYSETYYSGGRSRTRRVTKTREVVNLTAPVQADKQALAAGQPSTVGSAVDIPPDGPITFAGSDNWVYWLATVHIDIAKWPDWKHTYSIAVVPTPAMDQAASGGGPVVTGDGRVIG